MFKLFKIALLFSSTIVYAQTVAIDTSISPNELIENHLFDGCIEVSNVSSSINGSVNGLVSFGSFAKSTSNFPLEDGIVLSTGSANSAGNTIITADLNEGDMNWGTDSDLFNQLGIANTLNATSIEFDFISALDKIRFEYILASDEYLQSDYICDNQDSFVLLIREASSTGPYTNIANVGPQNDIISPGVIHPEIFGFCTPENESFFDNYSVGDTNFDGRTTPISSVATIIPNTLYHAKLIIADGVDQNFDSAVFIKTSIVLPELDLGNDISTCATLVNLNADIGITPATYDWYFNNVLVLADGGISFTATQTGSYTVKVTIPLNQTDCEHEDTINVTLSSVQTINPVSDYALCDANGDGLEVFDLSSKNSDVIAAAPPASYTITYHLTLADAQADMNPITTSIQNSSNPQIVYVRLKDNTGCLAYVPINLVVNPIPSIPTLNPFIVCDGDAIRNQTTALGLTSFNSTITNGDTNLDVSYHSSQADADSGNNPLPSNFISSSVQLFARIFNINTGCFNTTPIDIEVYNTPELFTDPIFLDACDPDHDGFASFDLETALPFVIANLTGITASFYTSQTDAQTQTNTIPDPTNYTNTTMTEEVTYVRIEDDISGCSSIRSFEIHTNLLLSETNLTEIEFCDDDGDGMHTFSFDTVSDQIKNMLLGLTITYYETLADQNNNNPITTNPYTFTGPSITLFIDIESSSCLEQTEIIINLIDIVQFPNIPNQVICDLDADGFTTLNLNNFDAAVTGNQSGFQIRYFETLFNAENNTGALSNNYINTSNPQTLFVSITQTSTDCSDYGSFEITVIPAPAINPPTPIVICDNDDDGFSIVNLDNLIPSLTNTPNTVDFSFFTTLNNANLEIDPITNTTAFNSQTQTLYIRAEETVSALNCPVIIPLNIIVNTLPIIPTLLDNYDVCIDSTTNPTFLMNLKDNEILNGQGGKEVFYYEDAGFTQLINKNLPYTGSNFPQTIFVKVDNITDSNCFSTSTFEINVVPFPVYNDTINIDIIGCDTNVIDGKIDIDLTAISNSLTQGINPAPIISFYTTLSNAETSTNALPLNYENTSNPQTLYVRIENNSNGCYLTDSFGINVLSTPDVRQINNLTQCDTNYDGLSIFNIENFQIEIFDVRQNFLVASYFNSIQELENGVPEISNITAFQTTSNPQTIYIKVLNTATQCYTSAPLTLTSILPPTINPISEFAICDTLSNTFELSEINSLLTTETQDISIQYFDSFSNAENEVDPIAILNYQTSTTPLFVRIENTLTNCYHIHDFMLIVNPLPISNQPPDLEACDDNFDSELEFDISTQTPLILGSQNPSSFTISYYENMPDAELGNNPLDLILTVVNSKSIVAKIVNNSTQCENFTSFDIIVNPLPIVDIPKQVICLDDLPLIVSANTFNSGDTYFWSTGQTTADIIINSVGTYSVTVTSSKGCVNSSNFEVIESEAATIEFTKVLNFNDPNSITITIEDGIGDYRYKLDDGPLQMSNFFNYVTLGYHTITVVDLNGCRETTDQVLIINAQKFFTPNNDTYFDTWNITGIETLPGSVIYVFNRYGKLLVKLNHNSGGWNGSYRGYEMPADDYWFLAKIKTPTEQFEYKGHFALKR